MFAGAKEKGGQKLLQQKDGLFDAFRQPNQQKMVPQIALCQLKGLRIAGNT